MILRARDAGLPIALAPLVLVGMNIVYALSAYPAGVISDGRNRLTPLAIGLALLIAADAVLAGTSGLYRRRARRRLWGLHMGLTQGLLATLVADVAAPELRGTAFGVFNLAGGVATLASSVCGRGVVGQLRRASDIWGRAAVRRWSRCGAGCGRNRARRGSGAAH